MAFQPNFKKVNNNNKLLLFTLVICTCLLEGYWKKVKKYFLYLISLILSFYSSFQECFSDEYHVYQFIQLHLSDYLRQVPIKINVTTHENKVKIKSDTEQAIKLK